MVKNKKLVVEFNDSFVAIPLLLVNGNKPYHFNVFKKDFYNDYSTMENFELFLNSNLSTSWGITTYCIKSLGYSNSIGKTDYKMNLFYDGTQP